MLPRMSCKVMCAHIREKFDQHESATSAPREHPPELLDIYDIMRDCLNSTSVAQKVKVAPKRRAQNYVNPFVNFRSSSSMQHNKND